MRTTAVDNLASPAAPADTALRSAAATPARRATRRRFLKWALIGGTAGLAATVGYGFIEPGLLRVTHAEVAVPRLPQPFDGLRVALLSDLHYGPYVSLDLVQRAVDFANRESPDLVALLGDYVGYSAAYLEPCFRLLAGLRAPLGVFGVPGNHDITYCGEQAVREALTRHGMTDVTNRGVWVHRQDARLRVGGVSDMRLLRADQAAALGDCGPDDVCLLLSHYPEYAKEVTDPRVGLVLAGHTHGGQVRLPFWGPLVLHAAYDPRFAEGLVRAGASQVYVSRGVGVTSPPVRINCPPEVPVLTLRAQGARPI